MTLAYFDSLAEYAAILPKNRQVLREICRTHSRAGFNALVDRSDT
jgi:hypothetical protein